MTRISKEPLVAITTPVYNGAAHLQRCIDSVLQQDYRNWRYLIVDNASRDATREIAEAAAARDDRIRVLACREFMGMLANFNRALAALPLEAVYVKQLHADDALPPAALTAMVEAAEQHPRAAMVIGRRTFGGAIRPIGCPTRTTVISGRDVARAALLHGVNYLGTPSACLLRRSSIEGWPAIFVPAPFPPGHPASPPLAHSDKEAYLATLEKHDVVFVPDLLLDQEPDAASATGFASRVGGWHPSHIEFLLNRGARFMSERELDAGLRRATIHYCGSLAWRIARGALRDPEFVRFQALCLEHVSARLRDSGRPRVAVLLRPFKVLVERAARGAETRMISAAHHPRRL